MPLIDAHMHFWRYEAEEFAWLDQPMASLRRDFLPAQIEPELARAGVEGVVAVQARQSLAETAWLIELKRAFDCVRGVVGWVDLVSSGVEAELDQFGSELVGVRHVLQSEPDPAFMLRSDFNRGIRVLTARGLTYDILIFPSHLQNAIELVDRHPNQRFVVDHLAKPLIRQHLLEPWASDMRELARRPNVCGKVSGLVTEADWGSWSARDFTPYLELALEAFGAQRLLFGSDYPVCRVAAEYGAVKALFEDHVRALSESEREAVLGGNALSFYGISPKA